MNIDPIAEATSANRIKAAATILGSQQAFASPGTTYSSGDVIGAAEGMTKREYIATQIAAGICACSGAWPSGADGDELANRAVTIADALLRELAR